MDARGGRPWRRWRCPWARYGAPTQGRREGDLDVGCSPMRQKGGVKGAVCLRVAENSSHRQDQYIYRRNGRERNIGSHLRAEWAGCNYRMC